MNWKSKIVTAISILESDMKAEDKVARALGFLEGTLKLDVELEKSDWFETIKGDCGTHKIDDEEEEELEKILPAVAAGARAVASTPTGRKVIAQGAQMGANYVKDKIQQQKEQ